MTRLTCPHLILSLHSHMPRRCAPRGCVHCMFSFLLFYFLLMSSSVVQSHGANDSHHDHNAPSLHNNACNTMRGTTLCMHLCVLKIGAHHQAPLLTVMIAMTHDSADKPPTSPCLYTLTCCIAVPLACCMNHAVEPSSPHAPRHHAPRPLHKPCRGALVTTCATSLCPSQLHAPCCYRLQYVFCFLFSTNFLFCVPAAVLQWHDGDDVW